MSRSFSKVDLVIGAGLFPKGVILHDDPSSGFCVVLMSGAAYTMIMDIRKSMINITADESIIQESMNRVFEFMLGKRFDELIIKDDDSTYGVVCNEYVPVDAMMERLFWIDVCNRLLYHPALSEFRDESRLAYTSLDARSMMNVIHEKSALAFIDNTPATIPESVIRPIQLNEVQE